MFIKKYEDIDHNRLADLCAEVKLTFIWNAARCSIQHDYLKRNGFVHSDKSMEDMHHYTYRCVKNIDIITNSEDVREIYSRCRGIAFCIEKVPFCCKEDESDATASLNSIIEMLFYDSEPLS